jgi:glyoxylase-like metal-dependent hydrolase (beta-lactamase superfamily II)
MKLGKFNINTLTTGHFALDGGAMFGVVPKVLWEKSNPADEKNRISMVTRSVLVQTEKRNILIDTGMGDKWDEKGKKIYKVENEEQNLESELKKFDLTFDNITDVILTHLHFDHTGGSTISDEKKIRPAFPNAIYYVTKDQWLWANEPSEKDRASFIQENFLPIAESGKLSILDHPKDFPIHGIGGLVSNGHTKGMWLPTIFDEGKTVVYCADLIPMSAHISVPWVMAYDISPLKTLEEKKVLLSQAEENDWILIFEHDPKISAVKLKKTEKGIKISEIINL